MNDASPLHQIRTPEGYEGWQWLGGPVFFYVKDDSDDSVDAQILATEWAEITLRVQRMQLEVQRRVQRVCKSEAIILNFEAAKEARENLEVAE